MRIDLQQTFSPQDLVKTFFSADLHAFHPNIIQHCNRPVADIEEMNAWILESWNVVIPEYVGRARPTVFLLGDVLFGREGINWSRSEVNRWLDHLHGEIILIVGNHDRQTEIWKWSDRWKDVFNQLELKFWDPEINPEDPKARYRIFMDHYRQATWNGVGRGTWHLFGHSHGGNTVWPTLSEIEALRREIYAGVAAQHNPEHFAYLNGILDRAEKAHRMRGIDVGWDPWHRPLSYREIRDEMLKREFFAYGAAGGEGE
jgi:calcineurin-like phosphoesterase family protein